MLYRNFGSSERSGRWRAAALDGGILMELLYVCRRMSLMTAVIKPILQTVVKMQPFSNVCMYIYIYIYIGGRTGMALGIRLGERGAWLHWLDVQESFKMARRPSEHAAAAAAAIEVFSLAHSTILLTLLITISVCLLNPRRPIYLAHVYSDVCLPSCSRRIFLVWSPLSARISQFV